ncbi:MAG: hypothetical protein QOI53_726, partial [Verrucomicrobiota bacterium]|nr:hypothetical protein [Verrucomicrobiota bacterium]
AGPVAFADAFHGFWVQSDLGVGREGLRYLDGVHWTNRIANGATNTSFHVDLVLQINIGDRVDRTKSATTPAINTSRLIDMILKLRVLHHTGFF